VPAPAIGRGSDPRGHTWRGCLPRVRAMDARKPLG